MKALLAAPALVAVLLLVPGAALAQYPDLGSMAQQNMAFDQQMNSIVQNQMAQNQMAQQQLMQGYMQQNGARLQQEYRQFVASTGMQIPFQTFVYNHMMTAGGTNPGPALEAQRRNFQGLQDANRTVQQGYSDYNRGWEQNQQITGNALGRYDQQAIQGNGYFRNPQTGEVHELPYGADPGYYNNQQNNFGRDNNGQWHQYDAQGYGQQLDQYDNYGDNED